MKQPAIYGIIGACAFSGASGWTYYKLYTQDGEFIHHLHLILMMKRKKIHLVQNF
ncbi:MAG: hypothetical protein V8R16_04845 [Bacilli bacterium]